MSQSRHNKKIARVLNKIGLTSSTKITDSLQGTIWRASSEKEPTRTSVVKVTNQYLHQCQMSVVNEKSYRVNEDILVEQSILKYLTQNEECPNSIVKFQRFFKTNSDYYLLMEDGGAPLFDFVMKAHKLILEGKIVISHWQKVSKVIFKQMVECIAYIHSKNVCHFDISLENFVINDVKIEVYDIGETEALRFDLSDIQIKLCDFGLAQIFTTNLCRSSKYCGKAAYKSPEVVNEEKNFDAKKNDIWCLGVCYFMICTGLAPWQIANECDKAFLFIVKYKKLSQLISAWNIKPYVDEAALHLFESIFECEQIRISVHKMCEQFDKF